MLLLSNTVCSYSDFFPHSPKQQEGIGLAERSKAAIALENCVMAAIHNQVFDNIAQIHKAEDTALHAFLEQLMAGQYDLYGTSPDLHVQVSLPNGYHATCTKHACMVVAQFFSRARLPCQRPLMTTVFVKQLFLQHTQPAASVPLPVSRRNDVLYA